MTYSRCLLVGVGAAALGALVSCKGQSALPETAAATNLVAASSQAVTVKAAKAKAAAAGANLGVSGPAGLSFVLQDPKQPGRPLVKLWAGSMIGNFNGKGVQGNLSRVSANLFQRGVAAAKLTATTVQGDDLQDVLTASGRVTVTSLQQSGTWLRADRIVWYPKRQQNQIVADGHVVYHDGKYGATMSASRMIADTLLRKIVVPSALNGKLR